MYEEAIQLMNDGFELLRQGRKKDCFDTLMEYMNIYERIEKDVNCIQYIEFRSNVLNVVNILERLKQEIQEEEKQQLLKQLEQRWNRIKHGKKKISNSAL